MESEDKKKEPTHGPTIRKDILKLEDCIRKDFPFPYVSWLTKLPQFQLVCSSNSLFPDDFGDIRNFGNTKHTQRVRSPFLFIQNKSKRRLNSFVLFS